MIGRCSNRVDPSRGVPRCGPKEPSSARARRGLRSTRRCLSAQGDEGRARVIRGRVLVVTTRCENRNQDRGQGRSDPSSDCPPPFARSDLHAPRMPTGDHDGTTPIQVAEVSNSDDIPAAIGNTSTGPAESVRPRAGLLPSQPDQPEHLHLGQRGRSRLRVQQAPTRERRGDSRRPFAPN